MDRIWKAGEQLAKDRMGKSSVSQNDIAWALFCDSIDVAKQYPSPPRSGYPTKSALSEIPEEISYFAKLSFALQSGEPLDDLGCGKPRRRISPKELTRAEFVLDVYHNNCLQVGDRKRLRGAMVALAKGVKPIVIRKRTGLDRGRMQRAKQQLSEDLVNALCNKT